MWGQEGEKREEERNRNLKKYRKDLAANVESEEEERGDAHGYKRILRIRNKYATMCTDVTAASLASKFLLLLLVSLAANCCLCPGSMPPTNPLHAPRKVCLTV